MEKEREVEHFAGFLLKLRSEGAALDFEIQEKAREFCHAICSKSTGAVADSLQTYWIALSRAKVGDPSDCTIRASSMGAPAPTSKAKGLPGLTRNLESNRSLRPSARRLPSLLQGHRGATGRCGHLDVARRTQARRGFGRHRKSFASSLRNVTLPQPCVQSSKCDPATAQPAQEGRPLLRLRGPSSCIRRSINRCWCFASYLAQSGPTFCGRKALLTACCSLSESSSQARGCWSSSSLQQGRQQQQQLYHAASTPAVAVFFFY